MFLPVNDLMLILSVTVYVLLILKLSAANIAIRSEVFAANMPLYAMVRGFDDLQYVWSISVAFRVDILVSSVITGSRSILVKAS